jgi:hypothetical protein
MADSQFAHVNSQNFAVSMGDTDSYNEDASKSSSQVYGKPKSEQLLDSSCRPIWNGVKRGKTQID